MKRFIAYGLVLIMGAVFLAIGCNTPGGDDGPGDVEEVIYSWGNPGYSAAPDQGDPPYKGYTLALAKEPGVTVTGTLKNINNYGTVTIEAVLYTDDNGTTVATQAAGLGHWNILDLNSDWDKHKLLTASSTYNMAADGESSGTVDPDKTTMPTHVLVQTKVEADDEGAASGIKKIEIRKVTFKPKTAGSVLLEKVTWGSDAGAIAVSGNTITFNNATYESIGAVLYRFKSSDLTGMAQKTVTVAYTVQDYTGDSGEEVQLIIQASGENKANYEDGAQDYNTLTLPSGSFTIKGSDLTARATSGDFELIGFRIVNNGTTDTENNKTRKKSFKLVINSVTVQ